jgi:hypothetical protein
LELRAGGLGESIVARVEGGTVRMDSVSGDAELGGSELKVHLTQVGGQLDLDLNGSEIELDNVGSHLVADLVDSVLVAETVQGKVQVTADGGSVTLNGARLGAEFRLGNTPLTMSDVQGGVDIETEADVQFRDLKSDLEMVSYGGGLRGRGNAGGVYVNSDAAMVYLEGIQGPVIVEGRELRISLREMGNRVRVATSMSDLHVESSGADVEVENDFGDVLLNDVAGPLKVVSRDGAVRIAELRGAVELDANGPEVHVSWSEIPADEDSSIENEGGDVSVKLPGNGRCRVEANAGFGGVSSDLPDVRVSNDGKSASGELGNASAPLIRIDSGGAVHIGVSESKRRETTVVPKRSPDPPQ